MSSLKNSLDRFYCEEQSFVERSIRVDHAGEYGAVCIYSGQELVLRKTDVGPEIAEMKEQEKKHFAYFDNEIKNRKIRPTVLLPIWHVMGVSLGAITALMGKKSAMACTVAVEEVIGKHYQEQIATLEEGDLRDKVRQFCQEELEHQEYALEHDAEEAFAYEALSFVVKKICRIAINLSKLV